MDAAGRLGIAQSQRTNVWRRGYRAGWLLAKRYPETMGKDIVIRVEGFDLPHVEVGTFFTRVSQRMFLAQEYREALRDSKYVSSITFEILFDYSVEGSATH